jgi:hypothetical protein
MTKLLLILALLFLLYQVARRFIGSGTTNSQSRRRRQVPQAPRPPRSQTIPRGNIDYSKIRDADYRDIR